MRVVRLLFSALPLRLARPDSMPQRCRNVVVRMNTRHPAAAGGLNACRSEGVSLQRRPFARVAIRNVRSQRSSLIVPLPNMVSSAIPSVSCELDCGVSSRTQRRNADAVIICGIQQEGLRQAGSLWPLLPWWRLRTCWFFVCGAPAPGHLSSWPRDERKT